MLLPFTVKTNNIDHLEIDGIDFKKLVDKYGTPLYIVDVKTVQNQCREYIKNFANDIFETEVIYASKAFNCIAMCQLVNSEGLSIDVSTGGELFIALKSGFDPSKIYFHGNNKSEQEIEFGVNEKVGCFIVDSFEEIDALDRIAGSRGIVQKIMIRITPGIHASTHEYIQTGREKSKFGFNVNGGSAMEAVRKIITKKNLKLAGIHSHIGSQIFNIEPYEKLISVQLKFISQVVKETGLVLEEINIGGGLGVKYLQEDRASSISELAALVKGSVEKYSEKYNVRIKKLMLEPGRSIVGNAGIVIYKIGVIKNIPKIHNYISVDGGMSDNIRPVLYGAKYSVFIADKMSITEESKDRKNWKKYTIVGKHCESGDILVEEIVLPDLETSDYIAMATAGAYCYSMSSNYNGQPRPAVIAVRDGKDMVWIEREDYEDLIKNHKKLV
ncbi:MAG TPA: diaminopimelate decarboxylase [Actinobacteria bacterium]|jgi:diaminopimelate decarboxylase|nr:diaminopimelate decarboxylase [Actinomycetota bacterium]